MKNRAFLTNTVTLVLIRAARRVREHDLLGLCEAEDTARDVA